MCVWWFFFTDLCLWTVQHAFRDTGFLTWTTHLQHPLLVSHLHFIQSGLLLPRRTWRRIQLVDVFRTEYLHVSISKRRTRFAGCIYLARTLLQHLDIVLHSCKLIIYTFTCIIISFPFDQESDDIRWILMKWIHTHNTHNTQVVMMFSAGYFRIRSALPKPVWTYPVSYISFHTYSIQASFKRFFSNCKKDSIFFH